MVENSTAAENRAVVVEEKKKKVPVFTVLKNNSILKNIFLIGNPLPLSHLLSSSLSNSSQEIKNSFINEQDFEEVLVVVGRHPDCNIILEHPSISRFHLHIHSVPSLQTLSVTDLSSVHGTMVCGKRIESDVRVELHEDDTLQFGESSRIYRLHWVPLSCAYDIRNPFVTPMNQPGLMEEREGEDETHQVESSLSLEHSQSKKGVDDSEGSALLSINTNLISPLKQCTPLAPEGNDMRDADFSSGKERCNPSPPAIFEGSKPQFWCEDDEVKKAAPRYSGVTSLLLKSEFDNQNNVLDTCSASGKSQLERQESPGVMLQIESGLSIQKRRGKSGLEQIQSSKSKDKSSRSSVDFDLKPQSDKSFSTESLSEGITLSADQVDYCIITPDKERCTPHTLLKMSSKKLRQEKILCESSPDSSNYDPSGDDEEAFTPGQENITPKTPLLRPMKMVTMSEETENPTTYRLSPSKTTHPGRHLVMGDGLSSLHKRNELGEICCDKNAAISSASGNEASSKPEVCVLKDRQNRVPFQSLLVSPNGRNTGSFNQSASTRIHHSSKNPNSESMACSHKIISEKFKKWTMVVDTGCLLHKESRKALQLMQGLPSTSLIIPRIVVRELDCMRRSSLFRSTKQISAALEWIEDCMVNARWWIHVQSSEDVRLMQPTPPASPFSRFTEENQRCQIGSVPFFPSRSLLEIISPTTEDHILDSVLLFRRVSNIGHLILLSDDLPLKIKAMAEGLRCERAVDFHESLVNPFSERFLWTGCIPRGLTWSCHDDVVLRDKYYSGLKTKQSTSVEKVKGLELVLFYNSHLRQKSLSN